MNLSSDLISELVKVTNDETKPKSESTVYGTTVEYNGSIYVRIDGSELLTPVANTSKIEANERVIVMIKNHTATVTGNLTSPSARWITDAEGKKTVEGLDFKKIANFEAENVTIKNRLTAAEGSIGTLQADDVTIKNRLTASEGYISDLQADNVDIKNRLTASEGTIINLSSDIANIDTLIFGSATGDVIQTSFANAVIAQLGDAQIKSAMIESIAASKITSGDIISNNVRVLSEDGKLLISDETIQISDSSRVRVQIGKDAENDYSINIWDANGNLMFSKGGITESAIKKAIIRNDMVANDANIHASKLNIDSLFEEINSDGTNVIKSTKITVDEQGQTLDAAFKKMATTESVDNLSKTVSSQGTQISANTEAISTKVWQQDINTAKNEMTTQYSTLSQDVNGFKTTVSNTYTTKADFNNLSIGGRNIILNSSFNHDGANWSLNTGPMHSYAFNDDDFAGNKSFEWHVTGRTGYGWIGMTQHFPIGRFKDGGKFILSGWAYVFSDEEVTGGASIELKKIDTSDVTSGCGAVNLVDEGNPKDEWFYFEKMYTLPVSDLKEYFVFPWIGINGHIKISQLKLEFGTKATDWTPAPEDMAASEDVAHAQTTADEATARITTAETLIRQLSDSISMLVTDGNGTSLMTQTDDGWVFSTADIQNTVNRISEDLSTLTDDVGNVDNTVSVLQQAVDDLGVLGEYIQITTYEDEPCIELGELDSDFKLRITNTRMMFAEGSVVLAYFTNQSFHSKKVVVEEELQQGGFVWKVRANGNLGLVWKGGNS